MNTSKMHPILNAQNPWTKSKMCTTNLLNCLQNFLWISIIIIITIQQIWFKYTKFWQHVHIFPNICIFGKHKQKKLSMFVNIPNIVWQCNIIPLVTKTSLFCRMLHFRQYYSPFKNICQTHIQRINKLRKVFVFFAKT